MAYTKRTWLGRQGTGLNKFSIGGASPVTIVNQPDSVTQVGDALSAGNLNDLEDRIEDAFDDVDTELDTKADEQDITNLNNAINQLDHRVQNLEQAHGSYDVRNYKDGSITPSGKGKWCVVEGVEGVSRVENQWVDQDYTSSTRWKFNNCTVTENNGVYTITRTASGSMFAWMNREYAYQQFNPAGHILMAFIDGYDTSNIGGLSPQLSLVYATGNSSEFTFPNTSRLYSVPSSALASIGFGFYFSSSGSVGDSISFRVLNVTDLTLYFGGTIPSDADTIAKIQQNYPHLLLPSDYGTRIVDWTGNGVRAEGVNIWDEEWELGGYDTSTGQPYSISDRIRTKNPMSVTPNTQYYINAPNDVKPFFYDGTGNFVGTLSSIHDTYITTPSNAAVMKFYVVSAYGATYNHDIQICLNSYPDKTTYHPYMENTLSFPSTTLKSAGSVSEMYYPETGEQTKPLYDYTITGNETMNYGTWADDTISVVLPGVTPLGKGNTACLCLIWANVLCVVANSLTYIRFVGATSKWASLDAFKADAVGKLLRYVLATPDPSTFVTPIIDNTLLTEAGGRMATVQTGTVVDGIADLGFITL